MPIDLYAPCPGGLDKKIKFCCSDLGGEFEKIERMLEGGQNQACLTRLKSLLGRYPNRACLMALHSLILRRVEQFDEAEDCTAEFLKEHPDNPIALADSAFFAVDDPERRPFDGMKLIYRAISVSGSLIHFRVYENLSLISQMLAEEYPLAARSLALIQTSMNRELEEPREFLNTLYNSEKFSILLKDDRPLEHCPEEVPWKDRFEKAISVTDNEGWVEATERFSALSEEVDDSPAIWRNLGMLRSWMADSSGSIHAMRKLATLDIPFDDAVEAEAYALSLSSDPLGDHIDISLLTYQVEDSDTMMERITSSTQIGSVQTEFQPSEDGSPPPRMMCALLSRTPDDLDEITVLEAIPQVLAQVILFGRQTDRPARLEVAGVMPEDLDTVKALVDQIGGDQLGSEIDIEVLERTSIFKAQVGKSWQLSENASREKFAKLTEQYVEDLLMKEWPESPLGCLDGKTPLEACQDESLRIRVAAAVLVFELFLTQIGIPFDVNRLRSLLGIPLPEPIDPTDLESQHVPLVRLHRLIIDKLSDEALCRAFNRAAVFNVDAAIGPLSKAISERPNLEKPNERERALFHLSTSAATAEEGLRYVKEGRQLSLANDKSCAAWDLAEIRFLILLHEVDAFFDLLEHLREHHMQEPGIERALVQILYQFGVLQPDGTLTIPEPPPKASAPSIVVPGQEDTEPNKVWTPDGTNSGDDKPKIWTPGSD